MLKDCDAYLRFVFFTGVTKFSKVSIFSDLNQLKDISLDYNYDAICGITQKELEENFVPEIEAMAERMGFTEDECLAELKRMYDGYHFCMNCPDIYNPFSLLNAFSERRLGSYWFARGTDRRRMLFHRLTRRDMQLPTVPTAASFSKSE